jgi:hypothetical protein
VRTGILLAIIGVWLLLNTVHEHNGKTLVDRIVG